MMLITQTQDRNVLTREQVDLTSVWVEQQFLLLILPCPVESTVWADLHGGQRLTIGEVRAWLVQQGTFREQDVPSVLEKQVRLCPCITIL